MVSEPFYDPARSYQDNFEHGPFGLFAGTTPHSLNTISAHTFLGHPVETPFGIPAGPLLHGGYVKAALDMGFSVPVYKTVRTRKYPCHPWPNVLAVRVEGELHTGQRLVASTDYSEPISITNSFGVPSFDPDFWQPDMADAAAHALPGEGRLRSGVCGAAVQWAGLAMTSRLKRLREALGLAFEIVGVGGVNDAAGYAAYRAAGADAVMSATGAMWNPRLAQQVLALSPAMQAVSV